MLPLESAPYFKAAEHELAHTNAQVIWHEQRGDYAVVLAMLPNRQPWYHLFTFLVNEWLLVESSFTDWIRYDKSAGQGVWLTLSPVTENVQRGRIEVGGQVLEQVARQGYLSSVFWDVAETGPFDLHFLELLVEDNWLPCLVSWWPATAQQFATAYLGYYAHGRKEEDWWAVDIFFAFDREDRLKLCLAVLDYADLATDEPGLGVLGAGPLEDLMSDWLLDHLETRIAQDARLRYALSMVRIEVEPKPLQERLAKLLKPGSRF